jgi:hypothetical protein
VNKTAGRAGLAALAMALTTTGLVSGGAFAQPTGSGTSHSTTTNKPTSTIQVVADGLNVPRGVIYDKAHNRVLVAEAGVATGDNDPCAPGDLGVVHCFGLTGSIFEYSSHSAGRIVTGLPSIAGEDDSFVLGVHDLSIQHGQLQVVFGMNGDLPFHDALGPDAVGLGHTGFIDRFGNLHLIGDLVGFEEANDPEPSTVDSDPYGLFTGHHGAVVADAGGNDILKVRRDGTIKVLAVLPPRLAQGQLLDEVPTTIVRGPDGAFYFGQLSGYPYFPGNARVYRLVPGHEPTVYAEGFTTIIDIAFDGQGRLIVLEIAKNGLLDPDQTGALIRVEHNGSRTVLASDGLTNPGGVALAGHGVFYVTNLTTGVGGDGQLLKITRHGNS